MNSRKVVNGSDEFADTEWLAEIDRRARRALSGEEPGMDYEEALDGLERELKQPTNEA